MAASTDCRKGKVVDSLDEYIAVNCRAHNASITEFGAVGDDKTSKTKAFKDAVDHLAQFSLDGGSQLYVPAGKWLTDSFSLVSHFTLFLHQDAVLLASQVGLSLGRFRFNRKPNCRLSVKPRHRPELPPTDRP
ncbi:unnamed protein product [Linum tenue]|uniref:Rhamnogalacturonase A/B/Epimerase-like pectate lyase domain-containing protein n=1 Tax=Linum tenue TaxID=586396 RepID=A0AAV0H955_9ROSI|nr:unnamed protein product [Linum tenue]